MPADTNTSRVADSVADSASTAAQGLNEVTAAAKEADEALAAMAERGAEAARVTDIFESAVGRSAKSVDKLGSAMKVVKNASASLASLKISAGGADSAMAGASSSASGLDKSTAGVAASAIDASDSIDQLNGTIDSFEVSVEGAQSVMDLFRKSMADGKDEAAQFAGGIGKTGGAALAAGAGIVYLTKKAGDLIEGYVDAAKSLSKFNVEAGRLAKTTIGIDAGGLDKLRDDLSLSKEEASNFYEVLDQGSKSGVLSVNDLADAAGKLRNAYGGDPTDKLKEFIGLVETIPTLKTDISVSASVDDQAASIFALAKAGKIDALIDVQDAGLMGGVAEGGGRDVKMLNEQQKAAKTGEDIKDALVGKLLPPVASHLPVIAKAVTGTLGLMGDLLGIAGGVQVFMAGRNIAATKRVEKAVYETAGIGGGGSTKGVARTIKSVFKGFKRGGVEGAVKRGFIKAGGKRAGRAFSGGGVRGVTQAVLRQKNPAIAKAFQRGGTKGALKALSSIGKSRVAVKFAKFSNVVGKVIPSFSEFGAATASMAGTFAMAAGPLALLTGGFKLAGHGLKKWSDSLKEAGNYTGAATAKLSGEVLNAAGTVAGFAAIGAGIGAIGGPIGAVGGAIIGLGVAAVMSGDKIAKSASDLGDQLMGEGTSIVSKGLGAIVKVLGVGVKIATFAIKEPFKAVGMAAKGIWGGFKEVTHVLGDLVMAGGMEAAARAKTRHELRKFDKALENASKPNKDSEEAQQQANDIVKNSALSLQRALKGVDAVSQGATAELAKMKGEVEGIKMDFFREIGGTMGQFNDAVKSATSATEDEFKKQTDAAQAQREVIARMDDLTAADREAALTELSKIELEAAKKFAEGMSAIIEGLLNTPAVAEQELKKDISAQRIDFASETGAEDIDTFLNEASKALEASSKSLEETLSQLDGIEAVAKQRRAAFKKSTEEMRKSMSESAEGLPNDVKAALAEQDIKISGDMSLDDMAAASKKLKEELDDISDQVEATTKGLAVLDNGGVKGLLSYAEGVNKGIEDAAAQVDKATKALGKLKNSDDGYNDASKKVRDADDALAAAQAKRGDVQDKIRTYLSKQTKDANVIAFVEATILGDDKKRAEIVGRQKGIVKKSQVFIDRLAGDEGKAVESLKARTGLIERQTKLAQAQSILEQAGNAERSSTLSDLEDRKKTEATIQNRVRAVNSFVKKITGEAGKEVNIAARRLKVTQSATNYAIATGHAQEQLEKENKAAIDLSQEELDSVKRRKKTLMDRRKLHEKMLNEPGLGEKQKKVIEGEIKIIDDGIAELDQAGNAARDRLTSIFDNMEETINQFMNQPGGRKAQAKLDFTSSEIEMTQFADTSSDAIKQLTKEAFDAAKVRKSEQSSGLATWVRNARASAKKIGGVEGQKKLEQVRVEAAARAEKIRVDYANQQLKIIKDGLSVRMQELDIQDKINSSTLAVARKYDGSARVVQRALDNELKVEKDRLEELKRAAKATKDKFHGGRETRAANASVVEQEAKVRNKEVDIVNEVTEIRGKELDIQKGIASTALDIAETFDGTASSIEGPMKAALKIEKERLATLKQNYEDLKKKNVSRLELETKGLEITQKQADIRKQELDIVEKIAAARIQELDIQLETAGVAREIAEAFDGSAASVGRAMQQEMAIEQQKLAEMIKERDELIGQHEKGNKLRAVELDIIKKQGELRKKELEIIKKVNELRMQEISTREEGLEAELDYLGYVGAHYSRMLDIQGQIVGLARERYGVEQDTLDDMKRSGATSQRLLEQETKVRKSWFEMQKKSLGVQKDVMEKILGAAFGGLSNKGPMGNLGSVVDKMGVAGSRAFSAAGMPMATGPGGGGTIAERSIMRQLRGLGGHAPRRLSAEEKLAKSMASTENSTADISGWTKDTANATGGMRDAALERGSLFTHDEGAHSLLAGLLSAAKKIAIMMAESDRSTTGISAKDQIEEVIKSAQKQAHTDSSSHEEKMADVAAATGETAKNTRDAFHENRGTAAGILNARSELGRNMKELERLRQERKKMPKEQKSALNDIEDKIASLEDTISKQSQKLISAQQVYRGSQFTNPFGGMAAGPRISGYGDIMSGRVDPLITGAAASSNKVARDETKGSIVQSDLPEALQELKGQLSVFMHQRNGQQGAGAARSVVEAMAKLKPEYANSINSKLNDIDSNLSDNIAAEDTKLAKISAALMKAAETFGTDENGGLTEKAKKVFDRTYGVAQENAERRKRELMDERGGRQNKLFMSEAEKIRKQNGIETPEEEQARYSRNLKMAHRAISMAVNKSAPLPVSGISHEKIKEFLKRHKTGGGYTRLEGKGPKSQLHRSGGPSTIKQSGFVGLEGKGPKSQLHRSGGPSTIKQSGLKGIGSPPPEGSVTRGGLPARAGGRSSGHLAVGGKDVEGALYGISKREVRTMSSAETRDMAAEARSARPQDSSFQASPAVARVSTPGEGSSGGVNTLHIKGDLTIHSSNPMLDGSFATMVADAVKDPKVQTVLQSVMKGS